MKLLYILSNVPPNSMYEVISMGNIDFKYIISYEMLDLSRGEGETRIIHHCQVCDMSTLHMEICD